MKKPEKQKDALKSPKNNKVELDPKTSSTIRDFVASRLHSLTSTSHINEYAISNYFDLKGLEQYKTTKIKKEGKGENAIIKHDKLPVDKFHATQSLLHLLFAWQELGQPPLEKYTHDLHAQVIGVKKTCPIKIDLNTILESISTSAKEHGHFLELVVLEKLTSGKFHATRPRESAAESPPDLASSFTKATRSSKSTKKAAAKRWEQQNQKYVEALELIKNRLCKLNDKPNWFHNDFVKWIFGCYKNSDGINPFITVTDKEGKIVKQGLSKKTLLKKTVAMFKDSKYENRIRGIKISK